MPCRSPLGQLNRQCVVGWAVLAVVIPADDHATAARRRGVCHVAQRHPGLMSCRTPHAQGCFGALCNQQWLGNRAAYAYSTGVRNALACGEAPVCQLDLATLAKWLT